MVAEIKLEEEMAASHEKNEEISAASEKLDEKMDADIENVKEEMSATSKELEQDKADIEKTAATKGLEKRKHDINIERALAKKMKKPPRGQKFIDISYMRPMEDNPFLLNPLGWGVGFGV